MNTEQTDINRLSMAIKYVEAYTNLDTNTLSFLDSNNEEAWITIDGKHTMEIKE